MSILSDNGGRLKVRLLRRLSVRSSSVNNVAACNPVLPPICSERNDVTSKTETEQFFDFGKNRVGNPSLNHLQYVATYYFVKDKCHKNWRQSKIYVL